MKSTIKTRKANLLDGRKMGLRKVQFLNFYRRILYLLKYNSLDVGIHLLVANFRMIKEPIRNEYSKNLSV